MTERSVSMEILYICPLQTFDDDDDDDDDDDYILRGVSLMDLEL